MVLIVDVEGLNDDEVYAACGAPNIFLRTRREKIRVTGVATDEHTPLVVRESLVGLVIPTIFTKEGLEWQIGSMLPIPNGSRLSYAPVVISVLKSAGKIDSARELEKVIPRPLDMYVFEREIYELLPRELRR